MCKVKRVERLTAIGLSKCIIKPLKKKKKLLTVESQIEISCAALQNILYLMRKKEACRQHMKHPQQVYD